MNRFFIGFFLSARTLTQGGSSTITMALDDVPTNSTDHQFYLTESVADVSRNADAFLLDSTDYGSFRAIVCETSSIFLALDEYLNQGHPNALNIVLLNLSASADVLTALLSDNCLTYGFFNKNLVLSFYMIVSVYRSQQILVLYDPDPGPYVLYQNDLMDQLQLQAELLQIDFSKRSLGDSILPILPNTAVYIIASATALESTYVNYAFLKSFSTECFIMMGDISEGIHDIFGSVPAFVAIPCPLDYTSTSTDIYLRSNKSLLYEIYPLYQIVYSLAKNTTFEGFYALPSFSLSIYLEYNTFENIPPPWLSADSFSQERRGPVYGMFCSILTKDSLFLTKAAKAAYQKYFVSGLPELPDSTSALWRTGITNLNSSPLYFSTNTAWYFHDSCQELKITRNSYSVDKTPFYDVSQNSNRPVTFFYRFNDAHYFVYLAAAPLGGCHAFRVNAIMSTPIVRVQLPSIL